MNDGSYNDKALVLDRPLLEYKSKIINSIGAEYSHVHFRCGPCPTAHLIKHLEELNIPYTFSKGS